MATPQEDFENAGNSGGTMLILEISMVCTTVHCEALKRR